MELESSKTSIDMIDLVLDIDPYKFQGNIRPSLDSFKYDERLRYWENFQWNRYRHNWKWETEDYSIFFSYKSNISTELANRFRLSYNPNKVDTQDKMLMMLLNVFKYSKTTVNISSFDVAFDYEGIVTSDLIIDRGRKREEKRHSYPGSDYTYYLGKSGTNGSVKIYDKANEETKGKADYNKTRLEVTVRDSIDIKEVDTWKCTCDIPTLFLKEIQGLYDDETLTDFEKMLLYSIENDYPMEKLSYRNRKKYEELADSRKEMYTKIAPSQLEVEKALVEFIKNLFN